ncbi:MAG: hypothetical protein ACUVS7_14975 [Bryobacteraceae bacterium]
MVPHLEYYSDRDGFWTGSPNAFREFTPTAESRLNDNLVSRVVFRKDWPANPSFSAGRRRGQRAIRPCPSPAS